ncbi:hypothetical protein FSP39_007328 [Pinctada imbricata]|uniref:PAS domain-containing protein n=1 Tax=Pinctada imbricata TaxID=66713 RepID=A0AA88XZ89_PINIB|nr:hypothetical protein FSP39_007328 [Pinctada imbricata]
MIKVIKEDWNLERRKKGPQKKSILMENENAKTASVKTERGNSKIDPSFKSKRYRDKLRTEIKGLESLIPVDRTVLHRKLDSQTVFRLVISFLRIKLLFKALGFSSDIEESPETSQVKKEDGATKEADPETYFQGKNIFQVDLMHRCLYGLVHHDDHFTLKSILEQTILSQKQEDDSTSNIKGVADMESVSFICRMKCFNGTSAGYLKIHCSGKVENIPNLNLKSNRGHQHVILLYCQPFMLTGNDIMYDVKQNVFWSKHDMDLTIRELDKKALEIIGYDQEELNDTTLYKYVHPEDLVTFAACHRMLTESTEVQTMYFRMESKDGHWIWLHSRGKVISKNSKKFSIVFTHCPVREEDSTFLQQETSLRQRYAINDLQYFVQNGQYNLPLPRTENDLPNEDIHGMQKISNFCSPHMGFTEDVSLSFYSPLLTCPSSWHALSDRHSPVLPSTHVAHKITQREKQLQFQEFKRRQHQEKHLQRPDTYSYNGYQELNSSPYPPVPPITNGGSSYTTPYIKPEPPDTYGDQQCYQGPSIQQSFTNNGVGLQQPMVECLPNSYPVYPMMQHTVPPFHGGQIYNQCQYPSYNFPPSPPISPMKYQHIPCTNTYQHHVYHVYPTAPVSSPHFNHTMLHPLSNPNYSVPYGSTPVSHQSVMERKPATCRDDSQFKTTSLKPQNIQLSVHCEPPNKLKKKSDQSQNRIQVTTSVSGQSCAVARNCCPGDQIEYDIEASIHMKIVENPRRRNSSVKEDLDLPSIGSFLEYLND